MPPESVRVVTGGAEGGGRVVTSVVGPYHEGDMLVLTCVAHGGKLSLSLSLSLFLYLNQKKNSIQKLRTQVI